MLDDARKTSPGGSVTSRDPDTPSGAACSFQRTLRVHDMRLKRSRLETVQINLGKLCNQTCVHCHVDAGPHRTRENMNTKTADRILELLAATDGLKTVDLTGGAPELNPNFRRMVTSCRALGLEVIDRCNLTVLFEPGQEDLVDFLVNNRVRIVASLPCYTAENVEAQRGDGVFQKSIDALARLNQAGYGRNPDLMLDLVYNPAGAFLPPPQAALEEDYRLRLKEDFGVSFTRLLALTNLPVKRFAAYLKQRGQLADYMRLLSTSFNKDAAQNVMCRSLVSISWDGKLFDCDFNQMEDLPVNGPAKDIWSINSLTGFSASDATPSLAIRTANHCFGCTAGQGSSCGGAVAANKPPM
jgi:radical SAM/Cys-rich protein